MKPAGGAEVRRGTLGAQNALQSQIPQQAKHMPLVSHVLKERKKRAGRGTTKDDTEEEDNAKNPL